MLAQGSSMLTNCKQGPFKRSLSAFSRSQTHAYPLKQPIRFIINPVAGTRSKHRIPDLIRAGLEPGKFDIEIVTSMHMGHATALAAEAVEKGYRFVAAVGGDGTMNEVAQALVNTHTRMCIVPFGSGNGLARHLGIPMQPAAAIKVINGMKSILMDACAIDDQLFFCTSGMGFDAHIGKLFAEAVNRGFSTYAKTTLKEFASFKPSPYRILVPGMEAEEVEAFMMTFANAGQYGNNAWIAPQADVQDGYFDLCVLKPFPLWAVPLIALRVFNRTAHKLPWWRGMKLNEVTVQRKAPEVIHLDGEPGMAGEEVHVRCLPSCLHVVVP
jgi:diacylglycerol kinase (ATP)